MKLKSGDRVKVMRGKDAGKESRVDKVFPEKNRVIVEGVNTAKKHERPRSAQEAGGIIDKDMPIDASNVMIICKECGPTRIGYKIEDGEKVRVCKKCGGEL